MRIALLLYGRLKYFRVQYENILNAIGKEHTVDIFLSSDNETDTEINEFKQLYKPISVNNDTILHTYNFNNYPIDEPITVRIDSMIRHFINLKRVFQLLETHVYLTNAMYELVITMRIDLHLNVKIDLPKSDNNAIYIPYGHDHRSTRYDAINDRFAMGNIDVMRLYNNIIDNCIYLLDNNLSYPHPEMLLYAHIVFNKLKVIRFASSNICEIIR